MSISLTSFHVEGLHGSRSVTIPIQNNRLVLVGENGSGKTTLINLLYFFLSRQWQRLGEYDFRAMAMRINDSEFVLTKEHLAVKKRQKPWPRHLIPASRTAWVRSRRLWEEVVVQPELFDLGKVAHQFHIPESTLRRAIDESKLSGPDIELAVEFQSLSKRLGETVDEQILYLPTYRRIEQDLQTIFPNIDHSELHEQLVARQGGQNFIELVEFGMEDVVKNISLKMAELKDDERNRLSKLTGSYLREVISGEYKAFAVDEIEQLNTDAINSILNRIGEDILPRTDKDRMRYMLGEIRLTNSLTHDQQVIAHFLVKLLQVNDALRQSESNVRQFVDICNKYLSSTGKQVIFDNTDFKLSVIGPGVEVGVQSNIALKVLSSGEKQIVSLFSHVLLSGIDKVFVLIDEPELSLSVPWQKTFLPDIFATSQCSGLIAVTHSPFIFQNEFDPYAHALNEFQQLV